MWLLGVAAGFSLFFIIFFALRKSKPLGPYEKAKPEGTYMKILKLVAQVADLFPFGPTKRKPTVDEVCRLAEKKTGLSDFGDHPLWKQSLKAYFDDVWAHNSATRRFCCRRETVDRLVRRLRVLDAFKKYPQALETKLPKPIFIVGMPRTGSTILHQLMAEDNRSMSVPCWQWLDPTPPEEGKPDLRFELAKEKIERTKKFVPILETMHLTEAHEADECYQGFVDFLYSSDCCLKIIPWLRKSFDLYWSADLTEQYVTEKKTLQLLLWQRENVSYDWMILKSPIHTISLENLCSVFPESTLIWTHRDMKSVVCSFAGLCLVGTLIDHKKTVNMKEIGKQSLEMMDELMRRGLHTRKKLEEQNVKFVDFYFPEFIKAPIQSIADLYGLLGLDFTPEAEQEMKNFYSASLEARKTAKKPTKFTLEELGLDANEIEQRFEYYYKQFPKLNNCK